jgi:hypothetical protein
MLLDCCRHEDVVVLELFRRVLKSTAMLLDCWHHNTAVVFELNQLVLTSAMSSC